MKVPFYKPSVTEAEISEVVDTLRNGWLTCDAVPEIVFDTDDKGKWSAALKTLGIDPLLLSSSAGRA